MKRPADQNSRDHFATELERNFSVVASAGSGKTSAITERIVQIARSAHAIEWLPQLVVVTFTNRAADEMQQRARQKIFEQGVSMEAMAAFNRAFFGTIHSFCLKLLTNHGHYLGLPARLDLFTDDTELWHRFVQNQTIIGATLRPEQRRLLTRLVQVRELMELGRSTSVELAKSEVGDCPDLCVEPVLNYVARKANTVSTIGRTQEKFREFSRLLREGNGYVPLPNCESGEQFFKPLCQEALAPLRRWIGCASLKVAAEIGRAYREFRLDKGALTYQDQVALAAELLQHPAAASRIREKNYRIILDEAQDTDPLQFDVLLEVARPHEARGKWLEVRQHPPRAGHFSMVGDFQQSIYPDRADLAHYRKIHEALLASGASEAVEFSVTFRLDQQQVDFVNATFRGILDDSEGQAKFVELNPRPAVLPGQVIRLEFSAPEIASGSTEKVSLSKLAQCEAEQLATWLRATGLKNLRARRWSDVAILCPRKKWFRPLASALRRAGFPVQIQSENAIKGDSPACAWMTALVTVMAEPRDGYEIAGVLRELYGISDHDLALFAEGHGERFQIAEVTSARGIVSDKLNALAQTRATLLPLPLFTAIEQLALETQLRQRLHSLPAEDFEGLDDELDALIALAATAEAEGKTLAAFAETLRTDFTGTREVRPLDREAIQLITSQKAKGSEWQAVIVPFLSRDVRLRAPKYPYIIKGENGEPVPVFNPDWNTDELKARAEVAGRQSMERLLYVALTRARHTLVLAADDKLFQTAGGECRKNCQTRWLRFDAGKCGLAVKAVSCQSTQRWQESEQIRIAEAQHVEVLPELKNVTPPFPPTFLQKLNPSGLGEHGIALRHTGTDVIKEIEPEFRPSTFDNPATRYGNWWHDFAELFPWKDEPAVWEAFFRDRLVLSPNAERSIREWKLLRDNLKKGSQLCQLLAGKNTIIKTEMPFAWRIDPRFCLEGIVDVALIDPEARTCLIIDWKTNKITAGETAAAGVGYRAQLAAYAEAIGAITNLRVTAGLYFTAPGTLVLYELASLAADWTELEEQRKVALATQ